MSNYPPTVVLNPLLHQSIRTRIVAFLVARGESSFTDLKNGLDITDGNLEAHMKKLIHVGYVNRHKESNGGRSQTLYSITKLGKVEFKKYLGELKTLLVI